MTAQVKRADTLGALSDLGSSARLSDARLTVGGRQYVITQLDQAYPGLTNGQIYQIYVTAPSATPALIISQSEPGTAFKLIGEMYVDLAGGKNFASRDKTGEGVSQTEWQSYTPSFAQFGSVTGIQMQWRQVGSSVEIQGEFTAGVGTGSNAEMSLPLGYTAKLLSSSTQNVGSFIIGAATNRNPGYLLCRNNELGFQFGLEIDGETNSQPANARSAGHFDNWRITLRASVPVNELQNAGLKF